MKRFGLIGKSLSHSFSKSFFDLFFRSHEIDASYENVELDSKDEIPEIFSRNFDGLNVTIPYKEVIIPFLDELDPVASEIGAVNVVRFEKGKAIGYNSDAFGFHQSIKPFLTNKHERAIIFGTGGASKAVKYVLESLGIDVIFVTRNPSSDDQFAYADVNKQMLSACKLLVNTTPVGMYPNDHEELGIPYGFIGKEHFVIDLIYNPVKTIFLKKAESMGGTILNGESMLKEQALKSWKIWNDR